MRVICQGDEDTLPESGVAPQTVSLVRCLPLAARRRDLAPRSVGARHRQNAVEHRAVIVARSARGRLLRREQRPDAFPSRIAQLPAQRRAGQRSTDRTRIAPLRYPSGGVTTSSDRLICPPPPRPCQPEGTLLIASCHCQHQPACFRHRERDHAARIAPFSAFSSQRTA